MSDARCRICRKPAGSPHTSDCVWEDLVVPSECEGVIEAAVAVVKNRDYARGVAAERARVVAWLRAASERAGVALEDKSVLALHTAAYLIEHGAHEEDGNG